MEHIPSNEDGFVTLYDHIKQRGREIDDRQIGLWTIQFCQGMAHAVNRGVVAHRDIKPLNILIDTFGFIKISDFGLAWSMDVVQQNNASVPKMMHAQSLNTQEGHVTCGTPGFIAPELFRSEKASTASDIFSFGIVLWQMAAGSNSLPYQVAYQGNPNKFQQDLYVAQMKHEVIRVNSIYWPVISRCLHPDPRQRYTKYDELREDVKRLMKAADLSVMDFIVNPVNHLSFSEFVNKGVSFSALGLYTKALTYFNEALKSDPKLPAVLPVLIGRGNTYSRMGNLKDALSDFNAAIALDANHLVALINRADCLKELGQNEAALKDLDRLLKINSNSPIGLRRTALDEHTYDFCGNLFASPHSSLH
jgi:serine/threonine protein kinase